MRGFAGIRLLWRMLPLDVLPDVRIHQPGLLCRPVGNEQETNRLTIDSKIAERPLRELYLRPFEIAIREARPWAVMSSYNLVNGVDADMNTHLLKDVLRGDWQYDG